MAEKEFDPFATSTGLADDIDLTFTNFKFGYNPSYVDSDTDEMVLVAICDLKTEDPDVGNDGVLEEQIITIGKGWEQVDGGKSVQREGGKAKGFNKSTYMGLLIDACIELDEDLMRERYEQTKLKPTDAAYWEGLSGHFVQKETEGFNGQKGRSKLLPESLTGWKTSAKPAAAKGAKKAASKPPAPVEAAPVTDEETAAPAMSKAEEIKARKAAEKAAAEAANGQGGPVQADAGDDPMRAAIIALAKVCTTDEEFITRAYDGEVPGLDESEEGMALVDDVESAESIWQTVGGSEVAE